MRSIHLTDLDAAVRSVLHLDGPSRLKRLSDMVASAEIGDRYRKRLGKVHPLHGSGTLASAAGIARTYHQHCDADYQACLADLLIVLARQRVHQTA